MGLTLDPFDLALREGLDTPFYVLLGQPLGDLVGIEAPEGVDGVSFAPLLRGDGQTLEGPVFSERDRWCMVCRGHWKLAADRNDDGSLALVDTGIKGAPKRIIAAITQIGDSVSDVTTIVALAEACAAALLKDGAKRVDVLTLARA